MPPRIVSRGAILLTGSVLFLIVTLGYAGPSWAIALYRLLTDGVIVLLWLGAAIGFGLLIVPTFVTAAGVLLRARLRGISARELGFVRPRNWRPVLVAWLVAMTDRTKSGRIGPRMVVTRDG